MVEIKKVSDIGVKELPALGIHNDMSNNAYHSSLGISKSGLDNVHRSPLHYAYHKNNQREQTKAMAIGTALHSLVLEPEKFEDDCIVAPEVDRRTKIGKIDYAEFLQKSEGKTIISQKDYDKCVDMRTAVYEHEAASKLLEGGVAEQSFFWIDENFHLLCKCRPDYLKDMGDYYIAVDVKTTDNADPKEWFKSAYKYRYHVQAGFYSDGIEHVTGKPVKAFCFVVVEKDPPHGVAVYHGSGELVNEGRFEYVSDLKRYFFCKENKKVADEKKEAYKWPGYGNHIQVLDLPGWASNNLRRRT